MQRWTRAIVYILTAIYRERSKSVVVECAGGVEHEPRTMAQESSRDHEVER